MCALSVGVRFVFVHFFPQSLDRVLKELSEFEMGKGGCVATSISGAIETNRTDWF